VGSCAVYVALATCDEGIINLKSESIETKNENAVSKDIQRRSSSRENKHKNYRHIGETSTLQQTSVKTNYLKLDGCIVWNAHNTVLGEEALLIYIVPVCYVKTGRYGKT